MISNEKVRTEIDKHNQLIRMKTKQEFQVI